MFLSMLCEYWDDCARQFSISVKEELSNDSYDYYNGLLKKYAPAKKELACLDMGCEPGFFSILLAKQGHKVTALDYSGKMLLEAQRNFEEFGVEAETIKADAHKTDFKDGSFDYIVSRNLIWNLEKPAKAYREWFRLLKPGGIMLIADGNHFYHYYDNDYRMFYKKMVKNGNFCFCGGVDPTPLDNIFRNLPLSREQRPEWDVKTFLDMGVNDIQVSTKNVTYRRPSTGHKRNLIINFVVCVRKEGKNTTDIL